MIIMLPECSLVKMGDECSQLAGYFEQGYIAFFSVRLS